MSSFHLTTRDTITSLLQQHLAPTQLEVIDDSAAHAGHKGAQEHPGAGHFRVLIISPSFEGKSMIERHRMVYEALGEMMKTSIHALALVTKAPTEEI